MHSIPVCGVEDESEFLGFIARDALPKGATIAPRKKAYGVNVDPATLNLLIGASKEILVAVIGVLGSAWVATISARSKRNEQAQSQPPAAPAARAVPAVEIDTVNETYIFVDDESLAARMKEVLPENVSHILNIRLTQSAPTEGR